MPDEVKNICLIERSGKPAIEGDSPVNEKHMSSGSISSTTGHVKSCGNPGRPLSKAKHYLVTDSEQVQ